MAKKPNIDDKMQIIFGLHPNVKEFYFSSDGQAFHSPNDAANHARTLADKRLRNITREMFQDGNTGFVDPPAGKTKSGKPGNEFQQAGEAGHGSSAAGSADGKESPPAGEQKNAEDTAAASAQANAAKGTGDAGKAADTAKADGIKGKEKGKGKGKGKGKAKAIKSSPPSGPEVPAGSNDGPEKIEIKS